MHPTACCPGCHCAQEGRGRRALVPPTCVGVGTANALEGRAGVPRCHVRVRDTERARPPLSLGCSRSGAQLGHTQQRDFSTRESSSSWECYNSGDVRVLLATCSYIDEAPQISTCIRGGRGRHDFWRLRIRGPCAAVGRLAIR